MVERRVEAVSIEGDTMYHLDEVVDVETLAVDDDQEEEEDLKPGAIPDALWSDEPLSRTPPQPSPAIEQLADKVEEQRLKRMSVIADLETAHQDQGRMDPRTIRTPLSQPQEHIKQKHVSKDMSDSKQLTSVHSTKETSAYTLLFFAGGMKDQGLGLGHCEGLAGASKQPGLARS